MVQVYKTPFAAQGDKDAIPVPTQGDGSVSLTQGFGYDYEREYEDPAAKDIRREIMNGILHDVTEALGQMQQFGFAAWQAVDGGWPVGANVNHGGGVWQSLANANMEEPGTGALWKLIWFDELPAASVSDPGITRYASDAQAQAQADADLAITPSNLAAVTATETRQGLARIATAAEVLAGSDNSKIVSPSGLAGLTSSESRRGLIEIATSAEALGLVDDLRSLTPKKLKDVFGAPNLSFAQNGFQRLPSGLLLQWGHVVTGPTGQAPFSLPVTFPNSVLQAAATYYVNGHVPNICNLYSDAYTNASVSALVTNPSTSAGVQGAQVKFIVLGY